MQTALKTVISKTYNEQYLRDQIQEQLLDHYEAETA